MWGWYQLAASKLPLTLLWREDEWEKSREAAEQQTLLALHKNKKMASSSTGGEKEQVTWAEKSDLGRNLFVFVT